MSSLSVAFNVIEFEVVALWRHLLTYYTVSAVMTSSAARFNDAMTSLNIRLFSCMCDDVVIHCLLCLRVTLWRHERVLCAVRWSDGQRTGRHRLSTAHAHRLRRAEHAQVRAKHLRHAIPLQCEPSHRRNQRHVHQVPASRCVHRCLWLDAAKSFKIFLIILMFVYFRFL